MAPPVLGRCRSYQWESELRSAEAVEAREALREQAHEDGRGQPDDVQVVALDALDERRTPPLDGIAAGAALPLAAREVPREVAGRQRPEGDERRRVLDVLPPRGHEREPGDDGMRAPAELVEHPLGVAGVGRLGV